jgi:hypothetical protein
MKSKSTTQANWLLMLLLSLVGSVGWADSRYNDPYAFNQLNQNAIDLNALVQSSSLDYQIKNSVSQFTQSVTQLGNCLSVPYDTFNEASDLGKEFNAADSSEEIAGPPGFHIGGPGGPRPGFGGGFRPVPGPGFGGGFRPGPRPGFPGIGPRPVPIFHPRPLPVPYRPGFRPSYPGIFPRPYPRPFPRPIVYPRPYPVPYPIPYPAPVPAAPPYTPPNYGDKCGIQTQAMANAWSPVDSYLLNTNLSYPQIYQKYQLTQQALYFYLNGSNHLAEDAMKSELENSSEVN